MDDEIKGEGNSVNYKYRMHDPRLGRFFAVDPLASKYPYNSTYAFSENNVIHAVELEGLEKYEIITGQQGEKKLNMVNINDPVFQVVENGIIYDNFVYCDFVNMMAGSTIEDDVSIQNKDSKKAAVKQLNVPNHPLGLKTFTEGDNLVTFALTITNSKLAKETINKINNAGSVQTGEINGMEGIEWLMSTTKIPIPDLVNNKRGFDVLEVYLPNEQSKKDFQKYWNDNDLSTFYDYKLEDVKFIEKPKYGDEHTAEITCYSKEIECQE
jgi:RHS repeat-associated protein